uniref:Tafazzin family protein n=1 Tax=Opuntia streptacantha TaxID=393608 RepID=A0A7C8YUZ7_OPUST
MANTFQRGFSLLAVWANRGTEREGEKMGEGRTMEWAARAGHMAGIPRRAIFTAVGTFAKMVTSLLNTTTVHNADSLLRLVRSRPPGVPLLTVSNHMSTLDDPLMWGFRGFPVTDAKLARWVLAAEDICFKNTVLSYLFRLGKCIPITRGGGIYQEHMNEALERLTDGEWVMPEDYMFGRRPPVPLINRNINIIIGQPIEFDLPGLMEIAASKSHDQSSPKLGWPSLSPHGLDETAQKHLYSTISEKIRIIMESLRQFGKTFSKESY